MEFILEKSGEEKRCVVVDTSALFKGHEDGLVQIQADGSRGPTLVSNCPKHDISRYGGALWALVSAGWRPFVFLEGAQAA